jgi:type II secretory ATPase GspE/PulE/Tfp pilus assembly ATPase PilB-like protein
VRRNNAPIQAAVRDRSTTSISTARPGGEEEDRLTDEEGAQVVKLANLMINQAIHDGASDIHVEPLEKYVLPDDDKVAAAVRQVLGTAPVTA